MVTHKMIPMPTGRSLRLEVPLPERIPETGARVEIVLVLPGAAEVKARRQAARRKLRELCKDSTLTVESFLAMKRADRILEAAQAERRPGPRKIRPAACG